MQYSQETLGTLRAEIIAECVQLVLDLLSLPKTRRTVSEC
jgi:hypothetical protein